MTYPSVVATSGGQESSYTTVHTVNLPAGSTAGELIVIVFVIDGTDTIFIPGFTNILTEPSTNDMFCTTIATKVATGSHSSVVISTTGSFKSMWRVYRISDWGSVAINPRVDGVSSTPSYGTATVGAADRLWIGTLAAEGDQTSASIPALTDSYTDTTGSATLFAGYDTSSSTSVNLGNYSFFSSVDWKSIQIAIDPTGVSGSANVTEQPDTSFAYGGLGGEGDVASTNDISYAFGDILSSCGGISALPDTVVAYGVFLPHLAVTELADTAVASGFAAGITYEQHDIAAITASYSDPCQLVKVYYAGEWQVGKPRVYVSGEWKAVTSVKVWDGSAWVGCS